MSVKLSIIVPVYNVVSYLRECLESVRQQQFKDWECICIDDGSTDGSSDVLDEYHQLDKRFLVIHQHNSGVSAARNAGLSVAKGEWITFLDSDDWVDTCLYGDVLARILANPDIDAIYHRPRIVDDAGNMCKSQKPVLQPRLFGSGDEVLAQARLTYNTVIHCVWDKFFRRSVIERDGLRFNEGIALSEDSLFVQLFLSHSGAILVASDICGYNYRMRAGSAIHSKTLEMYRQQLHRVFILMEEWRSTGGSGLLHLLRLECAAVPSLGLDRQNGSPCREACIRYLLSAEEFRDVIRFMLFHGSVKSRVFSVVYMCAPQRLKSILLRRV